MAAPLAWASPAAAEDTFITVDSMSGFQRADQRGYFQARALEELRKVLTSEDAADSVRALINDAGTYDVTTGTGGFNGSLRLELDRPENSGLKGYFAKLATAKAAIDEKSATIGSGIGPISYADLEILAAKVATKQLWRKIKLSNAKVQSGGEKIDEAFGTQWDTVVGRVDADTPDPAGRIPAPGASAAELKEFFFQLGNKNPEGGFGKPKPPFYARQAFVLLAAAYPDAEDKLAADDAEFGQWKAKYDRSKRTTTRTEFEVDYIEFIAKLGSLGATFDRNAYLVPLKIPVRKL